MSKKQKSIYIRDKSSGRVTFTQLSLYLLILFPITTILQTYIDSINRLLFGATLIVVSLAVLSKFTTKLLFTGIVTLAELFWALAYSSLPFYNRNDPFYYLFMVLLFFFSSYRKDDIDALILKSKKFIIGTVSVWCLLIAFAMVLPSSYPYHNTYFKPYGLNGFRSAPTALFIMTFILVLMVYFKDKRFFYLSVFPMYVLFMGSSRTYFGVGVLLFAILWYVYCDKADKFFITIIPIAVVGILVYRMSGISIKVENTTYTSDSYFDYWGTVTNGRSIFWKVDLEEFFKTSFIKQLFGSGFNFIYDVNIIAIGTPIWAHNDFIQMLLTYGYFGLFMYLYTIFSHIKTVLFKNKTKIPVVVIVLLVLVWLVNAFFNMFFTYFCSCISFPFISFALNKYFSEKGSGQYFEAIPKEKKSKKRRRSPNAQLTERPKSKYIR